MKHIVFILAFAIVICVAYKVITDLRTEKPVETTVIEYPTVRYEPDWDDSNVCCGDSTELSGPTFYTAQYDTIIDNGDGTVSFFAPNNSGRIVLYKYRQADYYRLREVAP